MEEAVQRFMADYPNITIKSVCISRMIITKQQLVVAMESSKQAPRYVYVYIHLGRRSYVAGIIRIRLCQ